MRISLTRLSLVLSFFLPIVSSATHLAGGSITYECAGNNQVVFTLRLYRECTGIGINTNPKTILTNASVSSGPIVANFVSSRSLNTDICYNATNFSCGSYTGTGVLQEYIFRSNPVSLAGAPPFSGWYFAYTECCRPGTANIGSSNIDFSLVTKIYPYYEPGSSTASSWSSNCLDSSPDFLETPARIGASNTSVIIPSFVYQSDSDSLNATFSSVQTGNSWPFYSAQYATGYSGTNPLPTTSGSSATINPLTGNISFSSSITGTFTVGTKYESFRNGQLISEVLFDLPITIISNPALTGLCSSNAWATLPSIQLTEDTTLSSFQAFNYSNTGLIDSSICEVTIILGDTFSCFVEGIDYGINPNCSPQKVAINVRSDFSADTANICPSSSCLYTTSYNSNGTLTSFSQSKVNLTWVPDHTQYLQCYNGKPFDIIIKVRDDWCPLPNARYKVIRANIVDPLPQLPLLQTQCVEQNLQQIHFSWSPNQDTGFGFNGYIIRKIDTVNGVTTYLDTISPWGASSYIDSNGVLSSQFGYSVDVIGVGGEVRLNNNVVYPSVLYSNTNTFAQTTFINWNLPHPNMNKAELIGMTTTKSFIENVDSLTTYSKHVFGCSDSVTYQIQFLNGCKSNPLVVYEMDTVAPNNTEVYWVSVDSANFARIYFNNVTEVEGYAILEGSLGNWSYIDTANSNTWVTTSHLSFNSSPTSGSMSYMVQPFDACGNYKIADTADAFNSLFLNVKRNTSNNNFSFNLIGLPASVNPSFIHLYERYVPTNSVTDYGNFSGDSITIPIPSDTLNRQYFAFGAGVGKNGLDLQSNTAIFDIQMSTLDRDFSMKIFPNPTDKSLKIKTQSTYKCVRITNSVGQEIYISMIPGNEIEINSSVWPKGIYLIHIYFESSRKKVERIIKN